MQPVSFQPLAVLLYLVATAGATASPGAVEYGGVIIAGGYDGESQLSAVEVIGMDPLPDLPIATEGSSLTAIGTVVYLCGGYDGQDYLSDCYALDTADSSPQWAKNVSLPVKLEYHQAVTIGSHIWITSENTLYDVDPVANVIETRATAFYAPYGHCAVSNGRHIIVLGVGPNHNQIWTNTLESQLNEWTFMQDLKMYREKFGCLLLEDKVFVTGGNDTGYSVKIYDIMSNFMNNMNPMQNYRYNHGTFVMDGQPAVAGGRQYYYENLLNTIEAYSPEAQGWEIKSQKLDVPKENFAITQFIT